MKKINFFAVLFIFSIVFFSNINAYAQSSKDLEAMEVLANSGKAEYQYMLALYYFQGEIVEQDYEMAFQWYSKAAEQDYPDAYAMLGVLSLNGLGTEHKPAKGIELLKKSVNLGSASGAFILAGVLEKESNGEKDMYKAVELYTLASEKGLEPATQRLNAIYASEPPISNPKSELFDAYLYALSGDANAQTHIAAAYHGGLEGVPKDLTKAIQWSVKAAEQDYHLAQFMLGVCYYGGEGVRKDINKSLEWFTKAAENDNVDAQFFLANMYYEGKETKKNYELAFNFFNRAAKQGDIDSHNFLSIMYALGEGVEQNPTMSYAHLLVGLNLGDKTAKKNQKNIAKSLTQKQIEDATVLAEEMLTALPKENDMQL